MRSAEVNRETGETKIQLFLDLDGAGKSDIDTGIGFMDHMLVLLAKHSGFDLMVRCDGDTYVDDHHSVEDIGISLGQAFREAIGDKRGIYRYADTTLAMDEALILTSVDISGRAYLAYHMDIPTEKVGAFDTELAQEFMLGFVRNSGVTLHIRQLAGENSHHIIEGMFKSLSHTLRKATEIDSRFRGEIPSTKGRLSEAQELSELTGQAYEPRRSSERPVGARPLTAPSMGARSGAMRPVTESAVGRSDGRIFPEEGISRGLGDGSYAKGIAKGVTEALNLERAPEISGGTPNRRTPLNSTGSKNMGAASTDATKPLSKPLQKKMSSTAELEKELQEKGLL